NILKYFPDIAVILLADSFSNQLALRGMKLGAHDYLKLPPGINELVDLIRKLYLLKEES
ncbi:MAG: response regulator, partial [Fibrobacteria bacterium]|nr:response regulator [Fibrobacteria bacterium]